MIAKFLRLAVIGALLLVVVENRNAALFARRQDAATQSIEARKLLDEGVEAYKDGQIDGAIADFQRAKDLDPTLLNAQLHLATAYSGQYIPGVTSPENAVHGEKALHEFKQILEKYSDNLSAIDGAGSILYNMASSPFDASKLEESKSYQRKHIELKPEDPEPYYWIGVIDWNIAYRANRSLREDHNQSPEATGPLPPALAMEFQQKYGEIVDEGITSMRKAMELRSDYEDAMAYLNLLYHQKADMEVSSGAREADVKTADDLVDEVRAIKARKMNSSQGPQ